MASPTPANLRLRMTMQLSEEIRDQSSASEGDALQAAATITFRHVAERNQNLARRLAQHRRRCRVLSGSRNHDGG